jgi:hypothetical protein
MKHKGKSIFYHRTNTENARAIVDSGFRNSSGYFLSNRIWTGVRLSSMPVDSEPGVEGDALLMVKLEIGAPELSRWEWTAEGQSHREWLMPAAIINKCATVQMVDQLDVSPVAA